MATLTARGLHPQEVVSYRSLASEPTGERIAWAMGLWPGILSTLALNAAKAMSPLNPRRKERVVAGQRVLTRALCLLDALLRVPLSLLDRCGFRFNDEPSAFDSLATIADNVIHLGVVLDRAACEVGLPLYDGGPFACNAPALPAAGPRLPGGAR